MKKIQIPDATTVIAALQNEIQRSADARYDHRLHGLQHQIVEMCVRWFRFHYGHD